MRNAAGQKPDALCRGGAAVSDDDDDESEDEIDAEECEDEEDGKVWVKALGSYIAHEEGELSLKHGERIQLLDYDGEDESGWWEAEKQDGSRGLVPASHVALCDEQGNLKDPLQAARFEGTRSAPTAAGEDDEGGEGDRQRGGGGGAGGRRERRERKRQEKVSRRIEKERSRLAGDTSETAIRQAVLNQESGYVRAIHSYRTKAKGPHRTWSRV